MEGFFIITGFILGGIVTFVVMNFYYERERKKHKIENDKLRDLNMRILSYMKEMGLISWNRDSKGNIIGFDIEELTESDIAEEGLKNRTLH